MQVLWVAEIPLMQLCMVHGIMYLPSPLYVSTVQQVIKFRQKLWVLKHHRAHAPRCSRSRHARRALVAVRGAGQDHSRLTSGAAAAGC
jgi:hypothetical protein